MEQAHLLLASDLLQMAADHFGDHGCNDWDWPESWSHQKRDNFARECHEWNGDPENFEHGMDLPDFAVMAFLAAEIRAFAVNDDG